MHSIESLRKVLIIWCKQKILAMHCNNQFPKKGIVSEIHNNKSSTHHIDTVQKQWMQIRIIIRRQWTNKIKLCKYLKSNNCIPIWFYSSTSLHNFNFSCMWCIGKWITFFMNWKSELRLIYEYKYRTNVLVSGFFQYKSKYCWGE